MTIRFGTDGWRGEMGGEFTFANVRRVTAAIAAYLERQGLAGQGVAVGYDRRFLSDRFAASVAGVLCARGISVRLATSDLPTPVISWAVRAERLAGGIVVTASHNPPEWNGIKFKEGFGGSARDEVNRVIEALIRELPADPDRVPCWAPERCREAGLLQDLDIWDSYRAGLGRLVDFGRIARGAPHVALDPMHGCGGPWLRRLLEEAGCRVSAVHEGRDAQFGGIGPEPLEARLEELMGLVRGHGCRLGLANDGDADRIAAVDEHGRYFSPQRVLLVLLRYLWEVKGLAGGVAKAVNATVLVDRMARRFGYPVVTTPIGFKHVGAAMRAHDLLAGGEESGSIGIAAHLPERDGLLNGLLLTEIVAATGQGLRGYLQDIFDEYGYFTYHRVDLPVPAEQAAAVRARIHEVAAPDVLAGRPVRETVTIDGTKLVRDDDSWLLMRASGTEPLLRLYAEAGSRAEVDALLAAGRRLVGI